MHEPACGLEFALASDELARHASPARLLLARVRGSRGTRASQRMARLLGRGHDAGRRLVGKGNAMRGLRGDAISRFSRFNRFSRSGVVAAFVVALVVSVLATAAG